MQCNAVIPCLASTLAESGISEKTGTIVPCQLSFPCANEALSALKLMAYEAPLKYSRSDAMKFREFIDKRMQCVCPEKVQDAIMKLDEKETRALFSTVSNLCQQYYWGTPTQCKEQSKAENVLSPALQQIWLSLSSKLGFSNPSGSFLGLVFDNFGLQNLEDGEGLSADCITPENFYLRFNFLHNCDAKKNEQYAYLLVKLEASAAAIYSEVAHAVKQVNCLNSKPECPMTANEINSLLESIHMHVQELFKAFELGRQALDLNFYRMSMERTLKGFSVNGTSPVMDPRAQLFSLQFFARFFGISAAVPEPALLLPAHIKALMAVESAGKRFAEIVSGHGNVSYTFQKCQATVQSFLNRNTVSTCPYIGRETPSTHRNLDGEVNVEFLIIGGGPAGMQAAYYLQKEHKDYVVLERADHPGSFFSQYPIHRTLISLNKVHTGNYEDGFEMRHDWNSLVNDEGLRFKNYSKAMFPNADRLVQYLTDFQAMNGLDTVFETTVTCVTRMPCGKYKTTATQKVRKPCGTVVEMERTFVSRYVMCATGVVEAHEPMFKGIEYCTKYENLHTDPEPFKDKRVLILGKGNSAFETADFLANIAGTIHLASPHRMKFAWDTHFVGHVRAVNNNVLDQYQLKTQVGIINGSIKQINRKDDGKLVVEYRFTETPEDPFVEFEYDYVITCTGWNYIPHFFDPETIKIMPIVEDKFPQLTYMWEVVDTPNLFFMGTPTQGITFRQNTSGFIHGFRYTVKTQLNYILHRDPMYAMPLPSTRFNCKAPNALRSVVNHALHRQNHAASIYQMFGYMCDVIALPDTPDGDYVYYYDLPRPFVTAGDLPDLKDKYYIVVSLEYGHRGKVGAFDFMIHSTPSKPELSWALHPILYMYHGTGCLKKQHLLENLEVVFDHPKYHVAPFEKFLMESTEHALHPPMKETFLQWLKDADLADVKITYRM